MQPYKYRKTGQLDSVTNSEEIYDRILRINFFQQKPYTRYTNSEIFQRIISADLSKYDRVFIFWGPFDSVKYTFFNSSELLNEYFHVKLKKKDRNKEKDVPPVSLYYNQNILESKELHDVWENSKPISKIKRALKTCLEQVLPESCEYNYNYNLIVAARNYLRSNKKPYKFKLNYEVVYENELLQERFDIKNKLEELKELCY